MRKLFTSALLLISIFVFSQSSHFITSADSTKLYVQEFGKGKLLIILAGGPGLNAMYMEPIWKKLSSDYRCIILDQRGTAKSKLSSVDSITVSLNNYVNDIEALRNHLKLDQLTLIGHSWGGMLSMEYAARHPMQVQKLILLNLVGQRRNSLTILAII